MDHETTKDSNTLNRCLMCGIAGITDSSGVSLSLYFALYALQHRGQESAGISTWHDCSILKHKGHGLVSEVFKGDTLDFLKGKVGIGHVRYPTTGENRLENFQPFNFTFQGHSISIAHNGNLINMQELREKYERKGQFFTSTTDTEIIAKVIIDEIREGGEVVDAVRICMRTLQGSYSVIFFIDGILYAFRDPLGIKPLCFGRTRNGVVIASESVAIDALEGVMERDINPGELIEARGDTVISVQIAKSDRHAHCIFEYIYFARADSVIDKALVYDIRRKIGEQLYREMPVIADSVSPVPDSGTAYALGLSDASDIPFVECLMKNRYMGRTFIMPTQSKREKAVRMKLNPIKYHLIGRSVVLVDDSIVRGTTSRRIIEMMHDAGASAIHMRIGSPPIIAPCYLGVDMPTREELIANKKDVEGVRETITAESLHYISLKALVEIIGEPEDHLCNGCLTGCYPISIPSEQSSLRCIDFLDGSYQSLLPID